MKCLRCGRTMKEGETECECGHFYDNNLHGERKHKEAKHKETNTPIVGWRLGFVIFILFILSGGLFVTLPLYIIENRNNKEKYTEVCNKKCEGSSFKVRSNKCICSNGEEYPIE